MQLRAIHSMAYLDRGLHSQSVVNFCILKSLYQMLTDIMYVFFIFWVLHVGILSQTVFTDYLLFLACSGM